jgi:hypothetical protein
MKVTTHEVAAPSSLVPACIKPYLDAIENIGVITRNITQTGVVISEAALHAAELSNAMIQLRLEEVASQLSARPSLT